MGGVSAQPAVASLSLLHTLVDWVVDNRQFTILQHVYSESVLTAVTCAKLVSGQSYPAYFLLHAC